MNKSKWWLYALVAYLLSLPLLFWKSSRVGKVLGVLLGGVVTLFLLTHLLQLGMTVYIKVISLNDLTQLKTRIIQVDQQLTPLHQRIQQIEQSVNDLAANESEQIRNQLTKRLETVEASLTEVETATADLRQEQRQAVKNRIIEIKEKVALLNQPLESAEIRKQVEEIIPGLKLLKEEEKARFLHDLQDIGFGMTKVKHEFNNTWMETQKYATRSYNGSSVTSGTIVMFEDTQ